MKPYVLPAIALAISLQGIVVSATAAPEDTFSPYVFASVAHDSNLLRLDSAATGGANTADTIRQAGAGVNVNWKVSRQQILLAAAVNENRFDRYSTLNYRGRDLRGGWNWQLDDHLNGDMGYTNNLAIGTFVDQQSLVSNLRIQERGYFDGLWSFHPSWQFGVGVSRGRLTFPDFVQSSLDRVDDVWESSLQYVSGANNRAGVKLRQTYGHYPAQAVDFVNMLDDGYRQRELLATVDWNGNGHTQFHGQAGAVQRRHNHFASRNYDDITARGTYGWTLTGHMKLNASAWREISAYDDLAGLYSRNRGVAVEPRWMPYSTITVSGRIQRERRDFIGSSGVFLFSPARQDIALARSLAVTYQPARAYSFNLSVGDDRRDSNQPLSSFYSKTVNLSATLQI